MSGLSYTGAQKRFPGARTQAAECWAECWAKCWLDCLTMVHHVYMTIAKVPNITGGRGTKLRRDGMELPDDAQARNCVEAASHSAADGVWHSMQARAWACLNCSSRVVDFAQRIAACTGECLWM